MSDSAVLSRIAAAKLAVADSFQSERAIVVRNVVPCQPCYRLDRVADCPLGHTRCQWGLKPEKVHRAVRELLGATPG